MFSFWIAVICGLWCNVVFRASFGGLEIRPPPCSSRFFLVVIEFISSRRLFCYDYINSSIYILFITVSAVIMCPVSFFW